jgi:hypothetical protein
MVFHFYCCMNIHFFKENSRPSSRISFIFKKSQFHQINSKMPSYSSLEITAIAIIAIIVFVIILIMTQNQKNEVIQILHGYPGLDDKELLAMQNAFNLFDKNGSGEINRKDFISAMNLQRREVENKTMYDLIVESAMTQNEPTVNFDQFVETMME